MGQSPFQALIFDLGGVIVAHDNAVLHERLASRCAPAWTAERVSAVIADPVWGTGVLPVSALHARLRKQAAYGGDWATFVDDWCCHLALDRSMLALLERLSARNRVMILSNTNQEHWDFAVGASGGALARFEPYLSHRIGHEKPSLRSFQVVAEKAGIDPARSIFFDDLPANVEAARRAGFQAEVFESEARLTWLLNDRGVPTDRAGPNTPR